MAENENNTPETVTIPAAQLEELLRQNELLKHQRDTLEYGCLQICGVLGLTNPERTAIKPEVASGDDGIFKHLMKAGADLFALFTKTSFPGAIGRRAEEKIKQDFAFVDKVLPVLTKKI